MPLRRRLPRNRGALCVLSAGRSSLCDFWVQVCADVDHISGCRKAWREYPCLWCREPWMNCIEASSAAASWRSSATISRAEDVSPHQTPEGKCACCPRAMSASLCLEKPKMSDNPQAPGSRRRLERVPLTECQPGWKSGFGETQRSAVSPCDQSSQCQCAFSFLPSLPTYFSMLRGFSPQLSAAPKVRGCRCSSGEEERRRCFGTYGMSDLGNLTP